MYKRLIYLMLTLFIFGISMQLSYGCTLWGSIGKVNKKMGLLIAKNRDSHAIGLEKLIAAKPKDGIQYIGLFYNHDKKDTHSYPYLSAGVNRAGLVIVNNSIATLDVDDRDDVETKAMLKILTHYHSVAEVLKDAKVLFTKGEVNNILIGDKKELAQIEIGKSGLYNIEIVKEGYLYHTNHYASKKLASQNEVNLDPSTYPRYQIISKLLRKSSYYTLKKYITWMNRQQHGPDNSLFRDSTLANWGVEEPKDGAPYLYVRFTNPYQHYQLYRVKLDHDFWKNPEAKLNQHALSNLLEPHNNQAN